MNRHLVIFARVPCRGGVKRRLAAELGDAAALRFYRSTTARLLAWAVRDRRWTCWLAVTPDRAAVRPQPWPAAPLRLKQGAGDLGRRMAAPFRTLPPGPVLLIGSDIPAIRPGHIWTAFRRLEVHDLVFGPALDGGFWLIGARSRTLPPRLFDGVRWSSEHALADTLANVPAHRSAGFADTLQDIDDAAAYRRWKQAIPNPLIRTETASDAPAGGA